jgi:(2R)-ethylmalonyl-CoA mutase
VVGVNRYRSPNHHHSGQAMARSWSSDGVEEDAVARLNAWRSQRDDAAVEAAIAGLKNAAEGMRNIMDASMRPPRPA